METLYTYRTGTQALTPQSWPCVVLRNLDHELHPRNPFTATTRRQAVHLGRGERDCLDTAFQDAIVLDLSYSCSWQADSLLTNERIDFSDSVTMEATDF